MRVGDGFSLSAEMKFANRQNFREDIMLVKNQQPVVHVANGDISVLSLNRPQLLD